MAIIINNFVLSSKVIELPHTIRSLKVERSGVSLTTVAGSLSLLSWPLPCGHKMDAISPNITPSYKSVPKKKEEYIKWVFTSHFFLFREKNLSQKPPEISPLSLIGQN